MVPYLTIPAFEFAGITVHPFGVFIALAVFFGCQMAVRRAKQYGESPSEARALWVAIVVCSFLGGHIVSALVYHSKGSASVMDFSQGLQMSSFGGVLFGVVTVFVFLRVRKLSKKWSVFSDIVTQGIIVAWILGRLGCSLAHDHQGTQSDFFLAVQYPGGSCHDLGWYEFLLALFVLFPLSHAIHRRYGCRGFQLPMFLIVFGVFRFNTDGFRTEGVNYLGFAPGEVFGCVATLLGIVLLRLRLSDRSDRETLDGPNLKGSSTLSVDDGGTGQAANSP